MAAQLQFKEHGQQSKIDDLTKLASINDRVLGWKVAEIGEDINKAICYNIINLCGSESVLLKDIAEKGILGVTFILF